MISRFSLKSNKGRSVKVYPLKILPLWCLRLRDWQRRFLSIALNAVVILKHLHCAIPVRNQDSE